MAEVYLTAWSVEAILSTFVLGCCALAPMMAVYLSLKRRKTAQRVRSVRNFKGSPDLVQPPAAAIALTSKNSVNAVDSSGPEKQTTHRPQQQDHPADHNPSVETVSSMDSDFEFASVSFTGFESGVANSATDDVCGRVLHITTREGE